MGQGMVIAKGLVVVVKGLRWHSEVIGELIGENRELKVWRRVEQVLRGESPKGIHRGVVDR